MRWLHFTDFHIAARAGAQAEALGSLLDFVERICSHEIDAVFLVGDIAHSGQDQEYERFEAEFLQPLRAMKKVERAQVFAVPGNHDVDCDAAAPITWESIKSRNQQLFFNENEEGRNARRHRVPTFGAYQRFTEWLTFPDVDLAAFSYAHHPW